MKWTCRKCWLLTLTRCDATEVEVIEPMLRSQGSYPGKIREDNLRRGNTVGCYKSAIQHMPVSDVSAPAFHFCEDHAIAIANNEVRKMPHTLLGLGRYSIPTKVSWVLLLLLLKFLLLPACGIELDILPFIEIKR